MDGRHNDRWQGQQLHMNVRQQHDSDSHQLVADMVKEYNELRQNFAD